MRSFRTRDGQQAEKGVATKTPRAAEAGRGAESSGEVGLTEPARGNACTSCPIRTGKARCDRSSVRYAPAPRRRRPDLRPQAPPPADPARTPRHAGTACAWQALRLRGADGLLLRPDLLDEPAHGTARG